MADTFKVYALLRRTPAIGYYEFRDFLRGDYNRAVLATKAGVAINRVVSHYVLERDFRPTTNADNHVWSAAIAWYFDDEQSALAATKDPEFLAVPDKWPDWIEEISYTVVKEVPMSGDAPGPTKVFAFFRNSLPAGNPMSREEMFRRWSEHGERMKGHSLDQLMCKFTQNQVLPHYHAANPRYDYDGVSEIWFETVEKGELLFKNYDSEMKIIPSSAQMGGTAGDCVYLRTDEVEDYRRS